MQIKIYGITLTSELKCTMHVLLNMKLTLFDHFILMFICLVLLPHELRGIYYYAIIVYNNGRDIEIDFDLLYLTFQPRGLGCVHNVRNQTLKLLECFASFGNLKPETIKTISGSDII